MKLKAIDALFGVIEDPTFFLTTPEMIKNAKLASVMALATWYVIRGTAHCRPPKAMNLSLRHHAVGIQADPNIFFMQAHSHRLSLVTILADF